MGRTIDRITLSGFKSLEKLENFELRKLNVLIGANGAGKSNFADFFRMLRALADESFQEWVLAFGGGDGLLFMGPKVTTPTISSRIEFGRNALFLHVEAHGSSGSLQLAEENVLYDAYSERIGLAGHSNRIFLEKKKKRQERSLPAVSRGCALCLRLRLELDRLSLSRH